MVKMVLEGRRKSNIIDVEDLYFINQNYKIKNQEKFTKITGYAWKIHFYPLQLISFSLFKT